jgi:hypothetical protein
MSGTILSMRLQELHSTRAPLKKDHRRGRGDPLRRELLFR